LPDVRIDRSGASLFATVVELPRLAGASMLQFFQQIRDTLIE
jgi:hypothetical protein